MTDAVALPAEQYHTVAEIADMWRLSTDAVRKVFDREPGVLVFQQPPKKYRRGYRTLRIPASVLARVTRRMTQAA